MAEEDAPQERLSAPDHTENVHSHAAANDLRSMTDPGPDLQCTNSSHYF